MMIMMMKLISRVLTSESRSSVGLDDEVHDASLDLKLNKRTDGRIDRRGDRHSGL